MMQLNLPDLFTFESGEPVRTQTEWHLRREELLESILDIEYGHLPPRPGWTRGELMYSHTIEEFGDAQESQYRLVTGPELHYEFYLTTITPAGQAPFPVVLNGDGCWRYVNDAVIEEVLGRGYMLAQFNRVTIVPDDYQEQRIQGLYKLFPGEHFGALSAWAWGYHRCVDFLLALPEADPLRIAVAGHSRGGKTVLLAGATDERIALTAPNNSGCGGAGCFRIQGEGSETLADILRLAPNWFSPALRQYIGAENKLPFDQHSLKALVAPRALFSSEALGDLWANPSGSWETHQAAREVYRFLGVEDRIGIWFREGEHNHGLEDWRACLDFADWQFFGKKTDQEFNRKPIYRTSKMD
jgi:hypothetical protein